MNASIQAMAPAMALALAANFGSARAWHDEFVALAKAFGGGSGCVVLMFEPRRGTLVNRSGIDLAADGVPIVAVELRAGADIDALMANIDWASAYERYQAAVHEASEPFGASQDELAGAVVLDVRRAGVFEQATTVVPGARWRDPAAVADWSAALPRDASVVVYCVYGHEVGRATAMRLRAAGVNARYLRGGIDGWQAAGQALDIKKESSS